MDIYTMNEQYKIFSEVMGRLTDFGFMRDDYHKNVYVDFNESYVEDFLYRLRDTDFFDVNIEIRTGATKCVIVLPDNDWVLKIPFNDCCTEHCELEAKNYSIAVNEGYSHYMAECCYLMDYEYLPCYIMRKAEVGFDLLQDDMFSRLYEQSNDYEYATENSAFNCSGDEYVEDLFRLHYGNEAVDDLYEFLDDNEIGDLHTGNVGYVDGRLVFIDYSGYMG